MKNIIVIIILLLIIFLLKKKYIYGGTGVENMPDGPEKDEALRKQKQMQENMKNKLNKNKQQNVEKLGIRQRLKKYVKKFGKPFITALILQRLYLPNPLEYPITREVVWFPLDNEDHMAIRNVGTFPTTLIWIPHLDELEELTDRMFSHSIPWPFLFSMDITISQLDIFAEWYEKYYILEKYPQKENYFIRKIKNVIDSLG